MTFKTERNHYFDNLKDIAITEDNKKLSIIYAGNLDLYWQIYQNSNSENIDCLQMSFEITQENYGVYKQFEQLFYDFKNINLFENITEEQKFGYRYFTRYSELFKDNEITWYSDETNKLVANFVKIKKQKDSFIISFYTQSHIEGYDLDTHHKNSITIRFRNSGSRYDPFNSLFMKMYNNLQTVDDVYDEGHQINFFEYLYETEKKLVKKKDDKK